LSLSLRLRNLTRGGLGQIWAVSASEEEEEAYYNESKMQ
jgi:hypothetical protein